MSLICGIISIPAALALIGGVVGLIGIIAGFVGLRRSKTLPPEVSRRGRAIAGIVLSAIGFIAPFVIIGGLLMTLGTDDVNKIAACNSYSGQERNVCIQAVLEHKDPDAAVATVRTHTTDK